MTQVLSQREAVLDGEASVRLLSPEYLRFRILFVAAGGQSLLAMKDAAAYVLPRVDLRRDLELCSQIQSYCQNRWSISCEVVDIVPGSRDSGLIIAHGPSSVNSNKATSALRCCALEDLGPAETTLCESTVLCRLLKTGETGRGPFSRLGWLGDVRKWLADVLNMPPHEIRLVQHKAEPRRSLVKVTGPARRSYWLKGGTDTERALLSLLGRNAAKYVPQIIAQNTHLKIVLMEDAGTPLGAEEGITDRDVWRVARRFASLQERTSRFLTDLREDFSDIPTTRTMIGSLKTHLASLEAALDPSCLKEQCPLPLDRVYETVAALDQVLRRLEFMGIPEVLLHDDLHCGNILLQRQAVRFVDWEEAHIGTLFENAEHLTLLRAFERSQKVVASAYGSAWQHLLSRSLIERAIKLSRPLAIASRLYRVLQRTDEDSLLISTPSRPGIRIMLRQLDRSVIEALESPSRHNPSM